MLKREICRMHVLHAADITAEDTITVLPAITTEIPVSGEITAEIMTEVLPARRHGRAIKTESAADRDKIKTATGRTVLMVKTEAISKTDLSITAADKTKADSVSDKADSVQAAAHRVQSLR